MNIRPARVDDVPSIHHLIKNFALQGKMVLRTEEELFAHLREFVVCEMEGKIVGCSAVHIFQADWAELKCLAVETPHQGRGIGRALCQACIEEMKRLRVRKLFALTTATGFFERVNYHRVAKETLPHFIWGECVRCPSFPVCNEDALVRDVGD